MAGHAFPTSEQDVELSGAEALEPASGGPEAAPASSHEEQGPITETEDYRDEPGTLDRFRAASRRRPRRGHWENDQ